MRAYVKVHCKPKTESLYRTAIDLHIVPALGAMAVKDVRSSHAIELHDRLSDTPAMANHVVAMLSSFKVASENAVLLPVEPRMSSISAPCFSKTAFITAS